MIVQDNIAGTVRGLEFVQRVELLNQSAPTATGNDFAKNVISQLLTKLERNVPHAFPFLSVRHVVRRSSWLQN